MTFRYLLAAAAALASSVPAFAHGPHGFAPAPDGGLSWELLAGTAAVPWVDANGVNRLAPQFGPEVEALDGTLVTIAGYRMPDDTGNRFTLYGSEVDCVFHLDSGPNMRMEVDAGDAPSPVAGVVTLRGRLELVRARQGGVFYRLHDASWIAPPA
ncbi:hypothetical protein [Croceicoccus sp. Ery5]|uniref:hypothetical protein n=1 Tax=Croceicoccus sp. Ery5 TaxID=1703340 RepID=UPI001E46F6B0|nr:hypothetical protein [Croceicoccus sp. Ery5]